MRDTHIEFEGVKLPIINTDHLEDHPKGVPISGVYKLFDLADGIKSRGDDPHTIIHDDTLYLILVEGIPASVVDLKAKNRELK